MQRRNPHTDVRKRAAGKEHGLPEPCEHLQDMLSVPPQWLPLQVATKYICRDYGRSMTEAHNKLCRDVQAGRVDHRIPGMDAGLTDLLRPTGISASPIEGTMFGMTSFVHDWTAVGVNWDEGTISPEGEPKRYAIEVFWPDIERRQEQPGHQTEKMLSPKKHGGRPPVYDWFSFGREMVRLANRPDGLPERRELVKHMSQWCEDEWGTAPSDSVIQDHVAKFWPEES